MITTPAWPPKEYRTGDFSDGHPSSYQQRPIGLNIGEQKGTGVFALVQTALKIEKIDWRPNYQS